MNTIKRRRPGLYDSGNYTLAIGSDWRHDGSHRPFVIEIIRRVYTPGAGAPKGDGTHYDALTYKRYRAVVPTLRFATAFRIGGIAMITYRWQQRLLNKLATT